MLTRLGEARDSGADRNLACALAGIAGALNTAGFYADSLYSSNMTGNVSALADHLAVADFRVAGTYLALVAIFIGGAAVSALLINAGRRRQFIGIYAFSVLAEGVLLAALACVDLWLTGDGRIIMLAFGLSFIMGMQNAVVTRISNARVRTTHVTGMVTDIGIELGNLVDLAWGRRAGRAAQSDYNAGKLFLHSVTVLSFLIGGIAGVLAYRRFSGVFLFGMAALLLLLAVFSLVKQRDAPKPGPAVSQP
jgi:uncharacterized membrane protein YoaK (UPF0700 family)